MASSSHRSPLPKQILRSMIDVIIRESRYGEIAMVIAILKPDFHTIMAFL